jgi:uncharacterized integral membrane protein (TIGR00698 family)
MANIPVAETPPHPDPLPASGQRESARQRLASQINLLTPGFALSTAVALAAYAGAPLLAKLFPIPAMVIALIIGIALNPIAARPAFSPGIVFSVKTLLRWAVALLGLRIALGEIIALGLGTALMIVLSMAVTVVAGFFIARAFGQTDYYGALAGAGTAVCGASATLATAAVLPAYKGKEADVAFVVIAVNALSTVAMVLYPPLCGLLGFDATLTGVMLGATIHDVAQVAGSGYAVAEPVGNTAVIVKLFRVLLLFPVVVAIAWWFLRPKPPLSALKASIPGFALVFLALCILNSLLSKTPEAAAFYQPVKAALGHVSTWGLLIAIAALGLSTSFRDVAALGWRHVVTVSATTVVILFAVICGLVLVR